MGSNLIRYASMISAVLVISFVTDVFAQGIYKQMEVGYLKWKIVDSIDEGEGSYGWGESRAWHDGYDNGVFSAKAIMLGCKNWMDPYGASHEVYISGHGQWECDDIRIMMPLPDAMNRTINRYYRYQPPAITVDDNRIDDPFPVNQADHVDPAKLPGKADGLIESFVNTDIGVSIHHRAIAFSQKNHNKYLIHEYIFKNTGNVDLDPEIELPGQNIQGFYFLKQLRTQETPTKPWVSAIGQYPGDELRICYGYSSRAMESDQDDFGGSITIDYDLPWQGQLLSTYFYGEQILFASQSPANYSVDDVNQPTVTGYFDVDFQSFTFHSRNMTASQKNTLYRVMQEGAVNVEGIFWPELEVTKPGHHGIPLDQRGFSYPNEMEGFGYSASVAYSVGPYDLAFGDSVKIVIAEVHGSISPEKCYEIGKAWQNNEAVWEDNTPGGETEILPKQYQDHPSLYESNDGRSAHNNWAKDNWVYTGFDSMIQTARAAKWAFENNYSVPQAPPAPSIEVTSLSDAIRIQWNSESEAAADFAGYRIYRAEGDWYPHPDQDGNQIGRWEKIYECGKGTPNPLIYEYNDTTAVNGLDYYYAVTAFDDGASNGIDFHGHQEVLESSMLHNMTTTMAVLTPNAIEDSEKQQPLVFALRQNYPNPFNPITRITFTLPHTNSVALQVYSTLGQIVATLVEDELSSGLHEVEFNAGHLPSGVYYFRIQAENWVDVKKMILIK